MAVVEAATPKRTRHASGGDLVTKLDEALEAENAPIRSNGPGILRLGQLILIQLFRPSDIPKSISSPK